LYIRNAVRGRGRPRSNSSLIHAGDKTVPLPLRAMNNIDILIFHPLQLPNMYFLEARQTRRSRSLRFLRRCCLIGSRMSYRTYKTISFSMSTGVLRGAVPYVVGLCSKGTPQASQAGSCSIPRPIWIACKLCLKSYTDCLAVICTSFMCA
jgi:hypothetical protein